MQGAIESVTIGTEERRLLLSNVQLARTLSIGSTWTKIRFGSRLAYDTTAWTTNALLGDAVGRMYYGMLASPAAGLTNGPLTDLTSHFVGFISVGSAATFAQAAGGGSNYRSTAAQNTYGKKVGSTVTTTAGAAETPLFSGSPSLRRTILIVDLEKSGGNMIISYVTLDANTAIADTTVADLVTGMNAATMTDVRNALNAIYGANQYSSSSTGTLAVNEGVDGALNAFCIAWPWTIPALHVSEVLWRKVS